MKLIVILTFVILTMHCQAQKENKQKTNENYSFYVGTYTKGDSEGIYKYALNKDGTLRKIGLAVKSKNPSFLALSHDKKYLVAVGEIDSHRGFGLVLSYLIDGDSLQLINKRSSGGANPCFISTNKQGFVLTANYSSGNVSLHRLNNSGELSNILDLQQHTGKGKTERQKSPHAHSSWFYNDDVISVDLGTDELWISKLNTTEQKLIPSKPNKLSMQPGDGPRHLTFHPNNKWIYVVNELSCTVTLVQKNKDGKYVKYKSISTLPKGYTDPNTCADIHISPDGKFLYASNRGHNSIAIFKVDNKNGSLELIKNESSLGDGPRNFSLSPYGDFLIVANQKTNNIISFKRDKATGLLEFVDQIDAPSPVCILFR
ncbi:MAG: lactonase family protein [Flavobacteriaceae bacterium]|nr:lactonase family protein [Flavobacteriaceae bacterium]